MELAELAAVLSAGSRGMPMPGSQPNSLETGLGLEATRNPIAALYYQAERGDRVNQTLSPEAMQAMQAQRQQEFELERLKAIAAPLATITGNSNAAIPGAMGALGVPLDDNLFALEQLLGSVGERATAAERLGSAGQSAAAGGYELNDILSQLDFGPLGRTTPTSVQAAGVRAASGSGSSSGPKFTASGYIPGLGVQVGATSGEPFSMEQLEALTFQNRPNAGDAEPAPTGQAITAVPPDIVMRFNAVAPSLGVMPQSEIELSDYDAQGRPIYIQRVVGPSGRPDTLVTAYDSMGNLKTTLVSRMSGGG